MNHSGITEFVCNVLDTGEENTKTYTNSQPIIGNVLQKTQDVSTQLTIFNLSNLARNDLDIN